MRKRSMDRQIVIARYNEDVRWAAGLPAIVYNKGAPLVTAAVLSSRSDTGSSSGKGALEKPCHTISMPSA